MTNTDTVPGGARFEVRVTADTHFGWIRTRLSIERTMMSWVRTAVSLIGFGFAIVQFFDRMQQMPEATISIPAGRTAVFGSFADCLRHAALVISIWQYWWTVRYLWGGSFAPIAGMNREGKQSPVIAVAVLLILIGLFAFFAVLLRLV